MFKVIFVTVVAMVFSGCVGVEAPKGPIGKGLVITKPNKDVTKTVQK